jgi:hypothetical protein
MTWRGTLLALLCVTLALAALTVSSRHRTRQPDQPILDITPPRVSMVTIRAPGPEIRLEKKEGVWMIVSPFADRADGALVTRLIEAAASLKPFDRLGPRELKGAVGLRSLDLKPAKRSVVFNDGRDHVLEFGAEAAFPGHLHARTDGDPAVYVVSSEVPSLAFLPADTLRDPRPFAIGDGPLSEIRITDGKTRGEFVLVRERGRWRITSPFRADADDESVSRWISSLGESRISRWMPEGTDAISCGLDTQTLSVELRGQRGDSVRMDLGSLTGEDADSVHARCEGRPGFFVLKGADSWRTVTPSLLRMRRVSSVDPDTVDRIVLRDAGHESVLVRKSGSEDWIRDGCAVPGSAVTEWFGRLSRLNATSFEAATPDHLAKRGMGEGCGEIRLVARLTENTAEESAGDITLLDLKTGPPFPDGTALRVTTSDDLMIVPSDSISELLAGPSATAMAAPSPAPRQ